MPQKQRRIHNVQKNLEFGPILLDQSFPLLLKIHKGCLIPEIKPKPIYRNELLQLYNERIALIANEYE